MGLYKRGQFEDSKRHLEDMSYGPNRRGLVHLGLLTWEEVSSRTEGSGDMGLGTFAIRRTWSGRDYFWRSHPPWWVTFLTGGSYHSGEVCNPQKRV